MFNYNSYSTLNYFGSSTFWSSDALILLESLMYSSKFKRYFKMYEVKIFALLVLKWGHVIYHFTWYVTVWGKIVIFNVNFAYGYSFLLLLYYLYIFLMLAIMSASLVFLKYHEANYDADIMERDLTKLHTPIVIYVSSRASKFDFNWYALKPEIKYSNTLTQLFKELFRTIG